MINEFFIDLVVPNANDHFVMEPKIPLQSIEKPIIPIVYPVINAPKRTMAHFNPMTSIAKHSVENVIILNELNQQRVLHPAMPKQRLRTIIRMNNHRNESFLCILVQHVVEVVVFHLIPLLDISPRNIITENIIIIV